MISHPWGCESHHAPQLTGVAPGPVSFQTISFCQVSVLSSLSIVTYFVLGDKLAHCIKVKWKTIPSATSLSSTDKGHSTQYIAMTENNFVYCEILKILSAMCFLVSLFSNGIKLGTPSNPAAAVTITCLQTNLNRKHKDSRFKRLSI